MYSFGETFKLFCMQICSYMSLLIHGSHFKVHTSYLFKLFFLPPRLQLSTLICQNWSVRHLCHFDQVKPTVLQKSVSLKHITPPPKKKKKKLKKKGKKKKN